MDLQRRKRRGGATTGKPQRFSRRPGGVAATGRRDTQGRKESRGEATLLLRRKRQRADDEEIASDSASGPEDTPSTDSESDEGETTDEARLRVARQYLKQFSDAARGTRKEQGASNTGEGTDVYEDPAFDSAGEESGAAGETEDDDSDADCFQDADTRAAITDHLKRRAEARNILSRPTSAVADRLRFSDSTFLRGHKLPVTCVALPGRHLGDDTGGGNASKQHVYTGGKDCCVIRWDLETGDKDVFEGRRNCFQASLKKSTDGNSSRCGGHFRAVLDICVAEDERVFFSAGADHTIRAWDPRASNTRCMFELRGHRGPVTGVRFNGSSCGGSDGDTELVTCSSDKSLKTWSISCRSVANHFYGHASEVNCMDLLQANKPITGGSDGTLRNWKLAQDTHTAFPPLGSCVDSVAMLSASLFSCGTQGGLLTLFNSNCKRPLACVRINQHISPGSAVAAGVAARKDAALLRATGSPTSVSALCALPLTDALLVGTEAGTVQAWSASQSDRKAGGGKLRAVPEASVQAGGAVNGLCVAKDHSFAVAAVSTESRLGRWYKYEGAKNGIRILPIVKE